MRVITSDIADQAETIADTVQDGATAADIARRLAELEPAVEGIRTRLPSYQAELGALLKHDMAEALKVARAATFGEGKCDDDDEPTQAARYQVRMAIRTLAFSLAIADETERRALATAAQTPLDQACLKSGAPIAWVAEAAAMAARCITYAQLTGDTGSLADMPAPMSCEASDWLSIYRQEVLQEDLSLEQHQAVRVAALFGRWLAMDDQLLVAWVTGAMSSPAGADAFLRHLEQRRTTIGLSAGATAALVEVQHANRATFDAILRRALRVFGCVTEDRSRGQATTAS